MRTSPRGCRARRLARSIGPAAGRTNSSETAETWETVRFDLYPSRNAWLVSIAMTCWFLTEIFGETYNVQIGTISDLAFNFVWVFYGTNIVCLALSGYRWKPEQPST